VLRWVIFREGVSCASLKRLQSPPDSGQCQEGWLQYMGSGRSRIKFLLPNPFVVAWSSSIVEGPTFPHTCMQALNISQ
jgi:hypothetical protein